MGASGLVRLVLALVTLQLVVSNTPPSNLQLLASGGSNLGDTVIIAVTATGTPPLTYQWYESDGVGGPFTIITGATNADYSVTLTLANYKHRYFVRVTNAFGSADSLSATLTVNVPPVIVNNPNSQIVNLGSTAFFDVVAAGSTPLVYQWEQSSGAGNPFTSIPGATSSTYSFLPTTANNHYQYRVFVKNQFGSTTSTVALLTILIPPTITTQPKSQTVATGNSVTFTVTATGTTPLGHQWYESPGAGIPFTAIPGANLPVYTFTAALSQNGYEYLVIIDNPYGIATSTTATLTVVNPSASPSSPPTTSPSTQPTTAPSTTPTRAPSLLSTAAPSKGVLSSMKWTEQHCWIKYRGGSDKCLSLRLLVDSPRV